MGKFTSLVTTFVFSEGLKEKYAEEEQDIIMQAIVDSCVVFCDIYGSPDRSVEFNLFAAKDEMAERLADLGVPEEGYDGCNGMFLKRIGAPFTAPLEIYVVIDSDFIEGRKWWDISGEELTYEEQEDRGNVYMSFLTNIETILHEFAHACYFDEDPYRLWDENYEFWDEFQARCRSTRVMLEVGARKEHDLLYSLMMFYLDELSRSLKSSYAKAQMTGFVQGFLDSLLSDDYITVTDDERKFGDVQLGGDPQPLLSEMETRMNLMMDLIDRREQRASSRASA